MEMDQVYAELAPKAGRLRELRAEANAYRTARLATPNHRQLFRLMAGALKAAARRVAGGKTPSVSDPITEE